MEQQNQEPLFDLRVDEDVKEQLLGLSKWGLILVVSIVINLVLNIIETFTARTQTVEYGTVRIQSTSGPNVLGTLIGVIVSGTLAWLLYQFSVFTKRGVDHLNQPDLNKGLANLRSYFMVVGIFLVVVMAIVMIALLILGSAAAIR